MNLQDIFDELTYGELSQLAIGGKDNVERGICEDDRIIIIKHVKTALTALYNRFRLREKSVEIMVSEGKNSYVLHQDFAVSNLSSGAATKYLLDTDDDKFDGSLIKIEEVCGSWDNKYERLPLNDVGNAYSVRTPSNRTLLLPATYMQHAIPPDKVRVDYRANHPPIDSDLAIAAPMAVEIELPVTHLQALLFHIASRIMNPTGMIEEFHSGNTYYAKYEGECARLEVENNQIDNMANRNSNFDRQGFR